MKKIKITESDLHRIIQETVENYVDHGEFSPIGNPYKGALEDRAKKRLEKTRESTKEMLTAISRVLYQEAQYTKSVLNIQNPLFNKYISDEKERKMAEIAQETYAKCMELYKFLRGKEYELEGIII